MGEKTMPYIGCRIRRSKETRMEGSRAEEAAGKRGTQTDTYAKRGRQKLTSESRRTLDRDTDLFRFTNPRREKFPARVLRTRRVRVSISHSMHR
jgi:hypothetical protein